MPLFVQLILSALIGYIWGSFPFGFWMGKLLRGKDFDIRDYGSRKIGATNVLRTLGKGPAALVFVLDLSKGIGPTLLATYVAVLNGGGWGPALAALLALIGHCYPVFIGFKGGRGVLTGGGALLILSWPTFVISAVVVAITIATSRYVSLGSILGGVTSIVCGIVFFVLGRVGVSNHSFTVGLPAMLYMIAGPALVIILHHDNIGRLLAGTERKIGQKVKLDEPTPSSSNARA